MDLKILKQLIAFDTRTSKSNLPLIRYCQKKFEECGFTTRTWGQNKKANLFAYKPAYGSRIVLSAHTDTVPSSQGWKTNPLELKSSGDSLFGLGISDMKAFIAIMLQMARNNTDSNLAFLLTYNEETDFEGAKLIGRKIIGKSDFVILGEPSDGKIISCSKGPVAYSVTFLGLGGHGSDPDKSASSILDATAFVSSLSNEFSKLKIKFENENFLNPFPTLNIGMINGGEAINSISVKTEVCFEIRKTEPELEIDLDNLIGKILKRAKTKTSILKKLSIAPFYSSKKMIAKVSRAGFEIKKGSSYCTEANILADICPNIVIFGPGDIRFAHAANEMISTKKIKGFEDNLTKLINVLK